MFLAIGCHDSILHTGGTGSSLADDEFRQGVQLLVPVDMPDSDVVAHRVSLDRVMCPGDAGPPAPMSFTTIVESLGDVPIDGVNPALGVFHAYGDLTASLEVGCYLVKSQPMAADGAGGYEPSQNCSPTLPVGFSVAPDQFSQVELIAACTGTNSEGFDAVVISNRPPVIRVPSQPSSGLQCRPMQLCVDLADPDEHALEVQWGSDGPTLVALAPTALDDGMQRHCAEVDTSAASRAMISVLARDLWIDGVAIEDHPSYPVASRVTHRFELDLFANPDDCGPSLDGGMLVYTHDVANPESSGLGTFDRGTRLETDRCTGLQLGAAKWNSDGSRLVGHRRVAGKDRIWTARSDCSELSQLTYHDDPYGQSGALFFSDNEVYYWRGPSSGFSEMNAILLDGSYLGTKSNFAGTQGKQVGMFDFSPLRNRTCYRLQQPSQSGSGSLHCADFPAFTNQITLGGNPGRLAMSPDGQRVAFFGHAQNTLYIADSTASGSSTALTTCSGQASGYPSFSPDSSEIAITCEDGGQWDLWAVASDGSGIERLTNTPDLREFIMDWR